MTNSDMILPTVTAKINSAEKYATENTTLVLCVPNVPSPPKTVPMAVPNTTPVTAAFPATEIRTVTFPTSPAPMAVRLTTAVRSAPPVKSNPDCSATAVSCDYGCASTNSCGICTSCSGNPDCDVTSTNPAITVALRPIPAASALPASLVLRRQTIPAAPMGRNLVPTVAAVPDCAVKGIPTVTAVPAGISLQAVHPLRFRLGQLQKFALAALLPAPATPAVPRLVVTILV